MTKTTGLLTTLNSLSASQIAEHDEVHQRFVSIFEKIHGKGLGEQVYHSESFHFKKMISEVSELKKCTQLSLYGAFIDVAVQGLSFDPSKKLCYLVPYSCKVTENGVERWENRASLQISGYGELYIRQKQGQILRADNVIIVYEGDNFTVNLDNNGNKAVEYSATLPRKTDKIIGSFIRIIRTDGSTDYFIMDEQDIKRLSAYSAKKNRGKANALYTVNNGQIDTGFLIAKTIKHAFKSYPKASILGNFSQLETEVIEKETINIDYGLEEENPEGGENEFNPATGEIIQTEATIQMTAQPSEHGQPITVTIPDELDF